MLGSQSTPHPPSTMGRVWLEAATLAHTKVRCRKVKKRAAPRKKTTPRESCAEKVKERDLNPGDLWYQALSPSNAVSTTFCLQTSKDTYRNPFSVFSSAQVGPLDSSSSSFSSTDLPRQHLNAYLDQQSTARSRPNRCIPAPRIAELWRRRERSPRPRLTTMTWTSPRS